jgi:RNA polymerase sigma-70 factor, ECF subfamily
MLSDFELVELCKNGKHKAQEELFDRFSAAMLSVCIRYCGNRSDGEDLLQEGFIKIFKNIHSFKIRNEGSLAAWIKRIMVNTSISFLNNRKKLLFIDTFESYSNFENDECENDDTDTEPPDSDELLKIISELPDGYRLVFNMYVMENMGHKEIAKELNITEGTSKSQLSKARQFLQKKLNQYYHFKKSITRAV